MDGREIGIVAADVLIIRLWLLSPSKDPPVIWYGGALAKPPSTRIMVPQCGQEIICMLDGPSTSWLAPEGQRSLEIGAVTRMLPKWGL